MDHKQLDSSNDRETKKCHFCGEEILAIAIKCKHCGSDLTEGLPLKGARPDNSVTVERGLLNKNTKLIIGVVIAAVVIPFVYGLTSNVAGEAVVDYKAREESSGLQAASQIDLAKYTAYEITRAYSENTVAADQKFKGERFKVSGVVADINTDFMGAPYITLRGGVNEFMEPQFRFEQSAAPQLAQLKQGDEVTLICIGNGDIAKTPMSESCSLLKEENLSDQIPSWESALQELFGASDPSEKVKTASDKLTSAWFDKSFKDPGGDIHVKFFKSQTLDASGEVESCHACKVDISAITYKKTNNQWHVVSKQIGFGVAGEYGDVEEADPGVVRLSSHVIALMLDSKSGGMGYFYEGKRLLTFSNNTWRDTGVINTGADNSADCRDANMAVRCWGYRGEISVAAGESVGHPNLLVIRTGTDEKYLPASNVTYFFEGGKYKESQSPGERLKE